VSDRSARRVSLPAETDTAALGAQLAAALPRVPPPRALRVFLHGELGAGKTTLVRGLLRALGEAGAVRSPTYALLHEYVLADWQITHGDLYRLGSPAEVGSLGFADLDRPAALWLIEWPERAAGELGRADLEIKLTVQDGRHEAVLQAQGEVGLGLLMALPCEEL